MADGDLGALEKYIDSGFANIRCEIENLSDAMQRYTDIRISATVSEAAARITSLERELEAKLSAVDKSTSLAAALMDKRLDAMNEFRNALRDAQSTFISRNELSARLTPTEHDVRELRESRATLAGVASQKDVNTARDMAGQAKWFGIIGSIVGIMGVVLAAIAIILTVAIK